nr:zinc finger BED domain-containing protein RICESLEEPER 2 [Tanacetum cinerariifolium]
MPPIITCTIALNPCFNVNGVDFLIESISLDLEFFDDGFASKSKSYFKESLKASEFAFSTSGRVLSIRRRRLTLASLELCMCLKDHLDAKERKQDKCPLEIPLDFEEDVYDDEVQRNEAISLSDEEIVLDASSEGTLSLGGPRRSDNGVHQFYKKCTKNYAASVHQHSLDGCQVRRSDNGVHQFYKKCTKNYVASVHQHSLDGCQVR